MGNSRPRGGKKTIILVIMVLIAAGVVAYYASSGIGFSQGDGAEFTTSADVDRAQPVDMVVSAPAGSEPASKALPDGYPGDVAPIYEPSTVTYAGKMGSGASLKYLVVADTEDDLDMVIESLTEYYTARGVKINETPLNDEGVGQMVFSKDDYGISITYSAADKPNTTNISYSVSPQRARN